jgi:hypothetical protein
MTTNPKHLSKMERAANKLAAFICATSRSDAFDRASIIRWSANQILRFARQQCRAERESTLKEAAAKIKHLYGGTSVQFTPAVIGAICDDILALSKKTPSKRGRA